MSRYYGNLRDTTTDIFANLDDEATKAIDRGMEIVRNRVDQYGVSEPSIQKLGGNRIIVELPGVTSEAEVRQLLQGTALLEFKLLKEPEVAYRVMEAVDKAVAADSTAVQDTLFAVAKDTSAADTSSITHARRRAFSPRSSSGSIPSSRSPSSNPQQFPGEALVEEENRGRRCVGSWTARTSSAYIPNDIEFVWSAKPSFVDEGKRYFTLYPVKDSPELTGGVIVNARATIDPGFNAADRHDGDEQRGLPRLGAHHRRERQQADRHRDGQCRLFGPVVRNKITGGHSQIEGMDNLDEARLLEIVLKAGALPAPVQIIEQRSVGPSLGEDSIRQGLSSALIATLLTIIFMVVYYRTGGAVADIALVFCLVFLLAVLAAFKGTLTLPGHRGHHPDARGRRRRQRPDLRTHPRGTGDGQDPRGCDRRRIREGLHARSSTRT